MLKIEPDAWYDEDALRMRGLDAKALAAARNDGKLRCRKVGRLRYYKGEWLSAWLESPEDEPRKK